MLPQRGKTRPNLDASRTRHVFRSGKTCRDTCHTEMGWQVRPPTGVGSFNFPHWGLFLKLRKSRHFPVIIRPQIEGERCVRLGSCITLPTIDLLQQKILRPIPPKPPISVPFRPVQCST